jgi:uracil phosphoribosyltransferase
MGFVKGELRSVCLIAAPYGVEQLHEQHPQVPSCVAALDEVLVARGSLLPGLGDVGDRQFGTL